MHLSYRDPEFWKNFRVNHWQPKKPTVIRQPFRSFPFSEELLFRAMANYEERLQGGDQKIPCLVSVGDDVKAPRRPLRKLFREKSETLEQLEQACVRAFPKQTFGLMVNDMQAVDPGIWNGVTAFLQDAHPWIGFPVPRSFLDLFYGNYSSSFTGIHKDTQEIIAFVVRGEKRILAWPFDYFLSKVKGLGAGDRYFNKRLPVDYRKYRKDALVLDAGPGDIIHWPSDYWHVAEPQPGRFTAMLSLGLTRPENTRPPLQSGDMTYELDRRHGIAPYLRWLTGFGFELGSSTVQCERPRGNMTVKKNLSNVIVWKSDLPYHRLIVASNGHSVTLPRSAKMLSFLELIAQGESISVCQLRASKGKSNLIETVWNYRRELKTRKLTSSGDQIVDLVYWLLRIGALEMA